MSPEIIASLRQLIERAIQLLGAVDPANLRPRLKQRVEITSPQSASLHEGVVPDYRTLQIYLAEMLSKLPEVEGFRKQVEADRVIGPHMNTLVGTSEGARRLSADELLRFVIWEYFERTQYSTVFDEAIFESTCEHFSKAFSSTTVILSYRAILENFKMTVSGAVEVAPGLTLRGLDSTEVERLWNENALLQSLYPFGGLGAHVTSISAVLETTRQTLKRIGEFEPPAAPPMHSPGAEVRADFDRVIAALRMMKPGAVRAGLVLQESDLPWGGGGAFGSGSLATSVFSPTYEFDPIQDSGPLQSLFRSIKFAEEQREGALLDGIRRIGFSSDRQHDEDKLLDIMIALEALVLNEVGTAQERGELRFRLALYTAKLLDGSADEMGQQYNLVRKAYDLRSKVVHGEAFNEDQRVTVQNIAETARRVGRQLLAMHQNGEHPDWDGLLGFKR